MCIYRYIIDCISTLKIIVVAEGGSSAVESRGFEFEIRDQVARIRIDVSIAVSSGRSTLL